MGASSCHDGGNRGTQEDRFWRMITQREENVLTFRNTDFDVLGKHLGQTVPRQLEMWSSSLTDFRDAHID